MVIRRVLRECLYKGKMSSHFRDHKSWVIVEIRSMISMFSRICSRRGTPENGKHMFNCMMWLYYSDEEAKLCTCRGRDNIQPGLESPSPSASRLVTLEMPVNLPRIFPIFPICMKPLLCKGLPAYHTLANLDQVLEPVPLLALSADNLGRRLLRSTSTIEDEVGPLSFFACLRRNFITQL